MREETMKIQCYLALDCASEEALRENIRAALQQEKMDAEVEFTRLTDADAERLGLRGSPSVLVDGEDILPATQSGFS